MQKLVIWRNHEISAMHFFYHMEIGTPKQLKQASFILALYRIHSRPKPSSFLLFWLLLFLFDYCYCFDYCYSIVLITVIPLLLVCRRMHRLAWVCKISSDFEFWKFFIYKWKNRQLSSSCLFRSFKHIFLRGDLNPSKLHKYVLQAVPENRFYNQQHN